MKKSLTVIYSDEDNEPMNETFPIEYTGIINDKLFRETGECIVRPVRHENN